MRSRSWTDAASLVLGAALEALWAGPLAALAAGVPAGPATAYAVAAVTLGGLIAWRARGSSGPVLGGRLAAAGLIAALACGSLLATRFWEGASPLWLVVRAVVYAAVLVTLGIVLGRKPLESPDALRRGVRAFLTLCLLLAVAAASGRSPAWAAAFLAATAVCGGLLVAVVRHASLVKAVPDEDRPPAWPWLLAVAATLVALAAVAAVAAVVLRVDVLRWALDVVAGGLLYVVQTIGYGLAWAAAQVVRGAVWLLGLLHVHGLKAPDVPSRARPSPRPLPPRAVRHGFDWWGLARTGLLLLSAVVAVAIAMAVAALALRRFQSAPAEAVEEERERVASVRGAAGGWAARAGRRLRRLVPRRTPPQTPADRVRRRYAALERRLARAGLPRQAGVTARAHLAACEFADASAGGALRAADLAAIYEAARYSPWGVDDAAARRFDALADAFAAPS